MQVPPFSLTDQLHHLGEQLDAAVLQVLRSGQYIGGSVIAETIFSIPGMGRLFYEAVMARDYPTVMALVTIGAVLTMLGNLLADLSYAYADPRIRVGQGTK